jgi:hypothetical protein
MSGKLTITKMNAPSFSGPDDIEEYLREMAEFLAAESAASGAFSAQRLMLARIVPDLTPEHWKTISARHDLRDWHVLPLPHASEHLSSKRKASIMVRADEKRFLFSGSV